jgi:signal transduction histidine kinase
MMWRFAASVSPVSQAFEMAGELVAIALPSAEAPREAQQRAVDRIARLLHTDLMLVSATREIIASSGRPLPLPAASRRSGGWVYGPGGSAWAIRLPDGRWMVARIPAGHTHPAFGLVMFLGAIALAVGLGAFPVVRRLTRRLERLQSGVESLGAGDLRARVKVEGRDEVARLAESFNRAATRIESLVGAHKMMLANASHELRTPLARIRLGIELLKDQADPRRKAELERDIVELDQLIDEILLASRLDAVQELETKESIDLLALAAEECARYESCALSGESVTVSGDPRLLRRMIRNLLENAAHHGKPPIEVTVRTGATAILTVCDHGPGIAAAEQAKLFEPFSRVDAAAGGTGLGLALVRQIARRHGGDAIYQTKEQTSCFIVTLPSAR